MGSSDCSAAGTRRLAGSIFVAAAVFGASSAPAVAAEDEPSATPYRPGVATPAALSAPGWLEIEAGIQHDRDGGGARADSLPVTLKLAFTPDWGIRLDADGLVRRRDAGSRTSGLGDAAVILKRRFAISDDQAFGLEGGATVPSGRRGLGSSSGKPDWGVNAIYSGDFGAWHADVNVAATRLGAVEVDVARTQSLFVAAVSRSLGDRWSAGAEVSATRQRGAEHTSQLLVGTSYAVSPRLVLDVGASRSLRSGPPSWSVFSGFTWLATRIF
ncbi:MAG: transporter [Caldimonas sp.]